MEWTPQELTDFIIEAGHTTYLSPEAKKREKPFRPECEEYMYSKGDWQYLDSYAWRKDGGGSELVYFKEEPIWTLNYYGYLTGAPDSKKIYDFLHRALKERHPELPVRGAPYTDTERGLLYDISFSKNELDHFSGTERIYQKNMLVYECFIHGGYIR